MEQHSPTAHAKLRLVYSDPGGGAAARQSAAAPPAGLDEYELLAAVRSGDDTAATAFYHRVRPRVDATIGRMLGRFDSDAEDIAQLSLIEIVRSIHNFRGECSLDAWTSRVTAHVVCKHIRRRRIERGIFDREPVETADGARPGPALVAKDLLERIRVHLDGIGPEKAAAFLLHDVCGFDIREAAQIEGVSAAAMQKRLVRGRREIRALISADPELAGTLASEGALP